MKRRTLLLSPLPFVLSSLVNAKPIEKTETAEIVIIGAGAAGLVCSRGSKGKRRRKSGFDRKKSVAFL